MEPPPAPISISSMVEMRIGSPLPSMKRFCRAASNAYAVSGSPVLAELGRDLVRRGDGDPAVPSGDGARGLRLVLAVRVGVQEDDGDRRHARVDERLGSRGDLARVEPPLHRAVGAQPLTYL